ncbi:uncharacterized protein BKA78DRAFT_300730 [Phyllosticta capitalensis]|uniref:uncharacterized protein n=1 Tax=Phyllosticta capitalensis TaxID=121624 RepID=UPI00312D53A1
MAPAKPSKSSTVLAIADDRNNDDPAKTTILRLREENAELAAKLAELSSKTTNFIRRLHNHETKEAELTCANFELEEKVRTIERLLEGQRQASTIDQAEISHLQELREYCYRHIDDLEQELQMKNLEAKGAEEDINTKSQIAAEYISALWRSHDDVKVLERKLSKTQQENEAVKRELEQAKNAQQKNQILKQKLEKAKNGQAELFTDLTTLLRLAHEDILNVPAKIRAAMRTISERIVGPWKP